MTITLLRQIVMEGFIEAEVTDGKETIDQHYYAVASGATIPKPVDLNGPEDKFHDQFGMPCYDALASGKVCNAMDGCQEPGTDAEQMDAA